MKIQNLSIWVGYSTSLSKGHMVTSDCPGAGYRRELTTLDGIKLQEQLFRYSVYLTAPSRFIGACSGTDRVKIVSMRLTEKSSSAKPITANVVYLEVGGGVDVSHR